MFLKRLELHGFKSFASGTTFEFGTGITAVVGPNGGGKSNVADALRWVTGEQNPRLLRSRKMDDVIFAGSASRAPLGMSEVRLTLDNSDNSLPLEFSDVAVARRLYRSGETEYVINGRKVRLKDVLELLAHAGLGSDSYLVVGQGMVDAALSLRAGERKSLFEQAADIRRHQIRRHEAQLRLDATERNIERVSDVTGELRPRLRVLEREAQAAREHESLSSRLYELLTLWYSGQWRRVTSALADATCQESAAHAAVERQAQAVSELNDEFEAKQSAFSDLQAALNRARQETEALRAQEAQHERESAVAGERRSSLLNRVSESGEELRRLDTQRAKDEEAVQTLEAALKAHEAQEADLQARLAQVQAASEDVARRRATVQRDLGAAERGLRLVQTELSGLRGRIAGSGDESARNDAQLKQYGRQIAELQAQAAARHADREKAADRCNHLDVEETQLAERSTEIQRALAASQSRRDSLQRSLSDATHDEDRLRTQQQVLAAQRQNAGDTMAGVQALMRTNTPSLRQGALGLLSGQIQVEKRHERAIEAALEPYLQALVVESTGTARNGAVHLRQTKAGRARFVTLDSLNGHRPPGHMPNLPNGVMRAAEVVRSEPRLRHLLDYILGNVYVVADLAQALELRPQVPPGGVIVTFDGERVDATGLWTAPIQAPDQGVLAKERRVSEASAQLREAGERTRSLAEELNDAQLALDPLMQEAEKLRKRQVEIQSARRAATSELSRLEHDEALVRQRIELLSAQQADLARRAGDASQQAQTLSARLAAHVEQEASLQAQVNEQRRALSGLAQGALQAELTDLRAKAAVAAERRNRAGLDIRGRHTALAEAAKRAEGLLARDREAQTQLAAIEDARSRSGAALEAVRAQLAESSERDKAARERLALLESEVAAARQHRGVAAARLASLENEGRTVSARLRECQGEAITLQKQIETELEGTELGEAPGVTAQLRMRVEKTDALPEYDVSAAVLESARQEIGQLRAQMRKLGVVNPLALREHEEATQRFAFLTEQADDLRKAARALRRVIRELDELMNQRFHATFEKVATEFQSTFSELFGGGTATLSLSALTDEEDPGIEIEVQPPGKRVRDLALLSGGERALTAVALLFAILKVNPSAICLLDEVDAMLDEANVGRFHSLLRNLSTRTQFIIITHNRNTMAMADTLYGVTMGRDHASTVVSLRLAGDGPDRVENVVAWQQEQEEMIRHHGRAQRP